MADVMVEDDGPVRIIKMNRPHKRNALTQDMYFAMTDALNATAGEDHIRVIVVGGVAGAFTAGNDLSYFLARASKDKEGVEGTPSGGATLLQGLLRNRKPLVAAVDGVAVGIGTTMLFHCDYVVASTDAVFATPFVGLGLIPEGAATLLVPAAIGHHRAFELLVMGRRMKAEAAYRAGFVNEIVESGKTLESALSCAREIAALPLEAVALTRRLMRASEMEIGERIQVELSHFNERMHSPEAAAAFASFLKK